MIDNGKLKELLMDKGFPRDTVVVSYPFDDSTIIVDITVNHMSLQMSVRVRDIDLAGLYPEKMIANKIGRFPGRDF